MNTGTGTERTILVGENELEVRCFLASELECLGYNAEVARDGDEVLTRLKSSPANIVAILLDQTLPNRDGFETLTEIRRMDPAIPVVVISAAGSTMDVVKAMKAGATDFLSRPLEHQEVQKVLARVFRRWELASVTRFQPHSRGSRGFVGRDPRMREIEGILGAIAWSEAPVLIQGESGSGKEAIARDLHARSPRADKPFHRLNCAGRPADLVESELFGYERGAFTGAYQKKAGMFELANGGTLLLDNIGGMNPGLQAKLLQVLQDQQFQRIGGKDLVKVDVRILAATQVDVEAAMAAGKFREDLYDRLGVINLHLPPLRERREDVIPLAEFLVRRHIAPSGAIPLITEELRHAIRLYQWPGNIRELENFIRRLIILRAPSRLARALRAKARRKPLTAAARSKIAGGSAQTFGEAGLPPIEQETNKEQEEKDAILAALESTRWNRKRAALLLEVDYRALLYKMKQLGVENRQASTNAPVKPRARAAGISAGGRLR